MGPKKKRPSAREVVARAQAAKKASRTKRQRGADKLLKSYGDELQESADDKTALAHAEH